MTVEAPAREWRSPAISGGQDAQKPPRVGGYFPPHVEAARRRFYADCARAGIITGWHVPGSHDAPHMKARPESTPDRVLRDLTHPLDKMILNKRRPLGTDEEIARNRYRAGMIWFESWSDAQGLSGTSAGLSEKVDSTPSKDAALVRLTSATQKRARMIRGAGIGSREAAILDGIICHGLGAKAVGKQIGLHHSNVSRSFLSSLDKLYSISSARELQEYDPPQ